jgi:hypothetical protein
MASNIMGLGFYAAAAGIAPNIGMPMAWQPNPPHDNHDSK